MLKSKKWALLAGLMIISMVVAACQPQNVNVPVTVVVKETQIAVQTVVSTVEVMLPTETPVPSYTTPHPILGDVRVRQAIAFCTNKPELIASVYGFLTPEQQASLVMDTFVPTSHWIYHKPTESYSFDVAKGGALLDDAGWKLAEGATYRADANGNQLTLKFSTTTAQFRQTWAAVFEAQMKACGIRILRFHVPAAWWFGDTTGLSHRDFELGAFAWVGQADPASASLYGCDQIPRPENGWAGQNYMGWCNEAASSALKQGDATLVRQDRIDKYATAQEEFSKDMPSLPLFNRLDTTATAADFVGYQSAPAEQYPMFNAWEWERPGKDTIVVGLSQEPASLYTVVENAYVAVVASSFIYGRAYTSLNYDFKANVYYKDLPTIENGGTKLNTVEVKAGDKVVDAGGNIVTLDKGMKVKDADGNEVEFDGSTPIKMQQLAVTGSFADGLKWSDGTPVTKDDIKLSDDIQCDKDSGAINFILCDHTASREYVNDTTETYTLLPGYLDPTYFIDYLPGAFPGHRVIESEGTYKGKTLAEVPAKDWATLPEVSECPMGYGPYTIACGDWVKGQSLTLQANPNFIMGEPKTKTIVIQIVQDTNQLLAQLVSGDVDVILSETTPGEEKPLADAQTAGTVKAYFEAGATWEHIDMQLYVPLPTSK
jgi:ABC-type transport system substrate-binding protein